MNGTSTSETNLSQATSASQATGPQKCHASHLLKGVSKLETLPALLCGGEAKHSAAHSQCCALTEMKAGTQPQATIESTSPKWSSQKVQRGVDSIPSGEPAKQKWILRVEPGSLKDIFPTIRSARHPRTFRPPNRALHSGQLCHASGAASAFTKHRSTCPCLRGDNCAPQKSAAGLPFAFELSKLNMDISRGVWFM